MAADSARANASPDHQKARHPAAVDRGAAGPSILGGDLDPRPTAIGRGPLEVVAALPAAPPEVRARVMGQLQRVLGNDYVQRVVSRARASGALTAAPVTTRSADSAVIRRAPPTAGVAEPTVGNPTGPAADPLDADAVKAAIGYHVKQPGLFPPALIKRIQTRLNVEASGAVDEDTVQAIARFQQTFATAEPPLKVDGKAGPRTLPMLFPSGLADEKHEQSFAKAAHDIFDEWDKLKDAKGRALALVKKVNHELTTAGVPAVNEFVTKLSGGAVGEFDAVNWIMAIDSAAVSKDTPTDEEAGEIVNT
ncbi:MAG: peptidoglycan-binding domain-containing protein, partial [Chloroflexota bacterium]